MTGAAVHVHAFDEDGDCVNCVADIVTAPSGTNLTLEQAAAWKRDVPDCCPCDYIWTGFVWTRSDATSLCDLHGHECEPGWAPQ